MPISRAQQLVNEIFASEAYLLKYHPNIPRSFLIKNTTPRERPDCSLAHNNVTYGLEVTGISSVELQAYFGSYHTVFGQLQSKMATTKLSPEYSEVQIYVCFKTDASSGSTITISSNDRNVFCNEFISFLKSEHVFLLTHPLQQIPGSKVHAIQRFETNHIPPETDSPYAPYRHPIPSEFAILRKYLSLISFSKRRQGEAPFICHRSFSDSDERRHEYMEEKLVKTLRSKTTQAESYDDSFDNLILIIHRNCFGAMDFATDAEYEDAILKGKMWCEENATPFDKIAFVNCHDNNLQWTLLKE